ncbi:sensor histidine kinase [Nakamurella sp.]|uniref:sensor histidine kinase n=1 Tax=Nakamurella sp. TaxID=1869182 RepID=UPI003B3B55ED
MERRRLDRFLDAGLALGLTAVGQVEVWSGLVQGGPRIPVAMAVAVGTAAVAVRRSFPLWAVLVSCGAMTVQAALGVDANTAFAPLLAAFLAIGTAGYLATRPLVALGCAIGLIALAVLIAHDRPIQESLSLVGDLLYASLLVVLAWLVGRGFAVARLQRQLSQERAAAAVARERLRIARDVHDIVAHSISVMTLHAGGARRLLRPDQAQALAALVVVERTGREALAEIRQVLTDVRETRGAPALTASTLDRAVEPLRAAGLRVDLEIGDLPEPLVGVGATAGLRVMQEAVTNILRHADASTVTIRVGVEQDRLRLEIVDDGVGIRPGQGGPGHPGHGIAGMRERLTEIGGTLTAGPAAPGGAAGSVEANPAGRGFRVDAGIPLERVAAR